MHDCVTYSSKDGVARIVLNDGKANILSESALQSFHDAFDQSFKEAKVVVLASDLAGTFSAGFDLKLFMARDAGRSFNMVRLGVELLLKILAAPIPIIAVCEGHAVAMGAFLLLACDQRIAAEGNSQVGFNEVLLGIPTPGYGIELARQRLTPAFLNRTAVMGEMLNPSEALAAGFFDRLVAPDEVASTVQAAIEAASRIGANAHAIAKKRVRLAAIQAIRATLESEVTLAAFERTFSGAAGS